MNLHIVPIVFLVIGIYWQGYNVAYYKFDKDYLGGLETIGPTLITIVLIAAYYGSYWFFKFIV